MKNIMLKAAVSSFTVALLATALVACGGSSSSSSEQAAVAPPLTGPATGTVGLLFTDGPTDEFEKILVTVTEASLLPEGASDDGEAVELFSGEETFDLLELRDYAEPFAFNDEVPVGDYRKLRLRISRIQLVRPDGTSEEAQITGNGKLDLNPRGGFTVESAQTLLIRLDLDANRSFLVVRAGNSGRYLFRPVVFTDIDLGDLRDRLVRVYGEVGEIFTGESEFTLCNLRRIQGDGLVWRDGCLRIGIDEAGAIFDNDDGQPIDIANLVSGDLATAIGFFAAPQPDELRRLDALLVQLGDRDLLERLAGFTDSSIDANGRFRLLPDGAEETITVALQAGAALITRTGERLDPGSIGVGAEVHVEGASVASDEDLRASLVIVNADGESELMLRGEIEEIDVDTASLTMTVAEAGSRCVRLLEDGQVTRIRAQDDGTVTEDITLADLEAGEFIDAYGLPAVDGCFEATSIVADETLAGDEEA